jgi:hypothetical protein
MADETPKKRVKVWSLPDSETSIRMDSDAVFIKANTKTFIAVDQNGITLRGNMSNASMGPGQRTGGFWIQMPEFSNMIPKTLVTPIPQMIPMPPIKPILGIIQGVTIGMSFLMG